MDGGGILAIGFLNLRDASELLLTKTYAGIDFVKSLKCHHTLFSSTINCNQVFMCPRGTWIMWRLAA